MKSSLKSKIENEQAPAESLHAVDDPKSSKFIAIIVPILLFASSLIMSFAWLGHLRFRDVPSQWAILFAWLLVLPEYFLNILALRLGIRVYSAGEMGAFNLCTGVVCVAGVSYFFLDEPIDLKKWIGFILMIVSLTLVSTTKEAPPSLKRVPPK